MEAVVDEVEGERAWLCPWVLPVGVPGREAVRAICVWPEPNGDDAEHLAVVDGSPYLFGTDVGEKRAAAS